MVRTVIAPQDYYVTVDAFDDNGDCPFVHKVDDLTFMQAADYAEHMVNYFRFAILDHAEWRSLTIEINAPYGVVEIIEITRDVA